MGKILDNEVNKQIGEVFAGLTGPVQILFFGSGKNCETCEDTRQLLEEVVAVNDKLGLDVYDLEQDADIARNFNVTKAPGMVIAAKDGAQITDFGIRFSGLPAGHEFSTLITDIMIVSKRDSGLNQKTRDFLKDLEEPLLLQVFVTPTCPYCPRAVLLAHQMAMENPKMIRAEGVEATEFPKLAQEYYVSGVPQTVINSGVKMVVGAVPEQKLLTEIMHAIQN